MQTTLCCMFPSFLTTAVDTADLGQLSPGATRLLLTWDALVQSHQLPVKAAGLVTGHRLNQVGAVLGPPRRLVDDPPLPQLETCGQKKQRARSESTCRNVEGGTERAGGRMAKDQIHSLKSNYPPHLHNNCSDSPCGMNKNTLIHAAGLDFPLDGSWQHSSDASLYFFQTFSMLPHWDKT